MDDDYKKSQYKTHQPIKIKFRIIKMKFPKILKII